ncbi:MAG: choice-of-anchor T family protein [Candidatus Thermoplasmatota archaeon]|nr:choice-of-anchor T family protein [Candidatus Thermoplasmatota archaeon]
MSRTGSRALVLSFLILGMGFLAVVHIPDSTDAAGGALVTINPDPGNSALYAEVDPVRGGIVTFTGTVSIEQPIDLDAQYVSVQLNAGIEGWQVTRIPLITAARLPVIVPFSVSAMVPMNTQTSGLDVTKLMTISGTWSYEPGLLNGQVEPVEVFIYIHQFYQYSVNCRTPYIHTAPGGEFDLELEITNEGNGDDEVTVDIQNRDRMEDNGWTFIFDASKWTLPQGETSIIKFHVTTPKKWDTFRNNIVVLHFAVNSEQASMSNALGEAAYYSVYVRQRGVAVPGFEAPLMALALLFSVSASFVRRRMGR